jgi:NAD(P)H-hydrate epimerase
MQATQPHRTLPKSDRLPKALYTAAQVAALDRIAIEQFGVPGEQLMARAGEAAYDLLRKNWPDAKRVVVVAGVGNNAGDGYVLAKSALLGDLETSVLQLGDVAKLSSISRHYHDQYLAAGGALETFESIPADTEVIVDAVFGIGLDREVTGSWAQALQIVNESDTSILSIDIPSGLNADTGRIMGVSIKADITMSFIALKQGMFTANGPECCGKIVFDALDVPAKIYSSSILSARRLAWVDMRAEIKPRSRSAHKGSFGHLLVIGGNKGYGGAAMLSATAALRTGCGLVSLLTHPDNRSAALAYCPDLMVQGYQPETSFESLLEKATVVAIGPGLGTDEWACALWERVRELKKPMVVDADALNLLARHPQAGQDWVLTPHPGEAARLLGVSTNQVQADRFEVLRKLVERYRSKIVLKGSGTLINSGQQLPPGVCSDGNPGMATAGMGDVLTGVLGSLLAQGYVPGLAVEMGVCMHSAAADQVAKEKGMAGMIASDVVELLPQFMTPVSRNL